MDTFTPAKTAAHVQNSTVTNAAAAAVSVPSGTRGVFITARTNGIIVTTDGSTASSTNGLPIAAATAPVFLPIAPRGNLSIIGLAAGASLADFLFVY